MSNNGSKDNQYAYINGNKDNLDDNVDDNNNNNYDEDVD